MESNNQRIIFDVSGDATAAQIMLGILEKNGIQNPSDDLSEEVPKLVVVNNMAKDLFEKKVSKEEGINLLRSKLSVSEEVASKITSDIETNLIPFAKKINIPADETNLSKNQKSSDLVFDVKQPVGAEGALKKTKTINARPQEKPTEIKTEIDNNKKTKIPKKYSKKNKTTDEFANLQPAQPKKSDTYREPIE